MNSSQQEIRAKAAGLLRDGQADLFIGFSEGTLPMSATPCFIDDADAAEQLVWNSYCSNNLAVYLPGCFAPDPRLREQPAAPKVAILVKGCDGRSAVGLIKEGQVPRENVVLVAAPCHGMLDRSVAQRLLGAAELVAAKEGDGVVTVTDDAGKETELSRDELLAEACRFCTHRSASVYDVAVGDLAQQPAPPATDDPFEQFAAKPRADRWEQFCREVSKCILCKACRSACPNCYCKTCFVDRDRPRWLGVGDELSEAAFYHLGRMFHQAGRCVDCGACVRACSMGVDLRTFTHRLVRDAAELFGAVPGLDLDEAPALTQFDPDDPEDFITEPE